jgi:TusA-related sulfurtransferase
MNASNPTRELSALHARRQISSPSLAGDPAWEMLLHLFIARSECREMSVGELAKVATISPSTAIRYLEFMESEGTVAILEVTDESRAVATLSDSTTNRIVAYLEEFS